MSEFKVVALLKAKDGMSKEALIEHYENIHAPLIRSQFPSITAYRRNYCDFADAYVYPDAAPFDFDMVTEIWFADEEGYRDMQRRYENPEVLAKIKEDESKFLDSGKTRMFVVDERVSVFD